MNQRIKILAMANQAFDESSFTDREVIKLTELIIKKCAAIIDDIPTAPQGAWSDGYYEGCRDSVKAIQQHFGII
jgi:hypothetical protein